MKKTYYNIKDFNLADYVFYPSIETPDDILKQYLDFVSKSDISKKNPIKSKIFKKLKNTCKKIAVKNSTVFKIATQLYLHNYFLASRQIFRLVDKTFIYNKDILNFVHQVYLNNCNDYNLKKIFHRMFDFDRFEIFETYIAQYEKICGSNEYYNILHLLLCDLLNNSQEIDPNLAKKLPDTIFEIYSSEKKKEETNNIFQINLIGDLVEIMLNINSQGHAKLLIDNFYPSEYRILLLSKIL